MKLDHTFIAIRERGILEICDLALHVIRDHFKPLILLLLIGAFPWVVVDWLITNWLITDDLGTEYLNLYFWLMALLVVSQAQVGTTFITYYLGQAMFVGRPGIRETLAGSFHASPYFFWCHGGVRLVVPVLIFAWLTRRVETEGLWALCGFFIPVIVGISLLVRGIRPFASEMLLLEKTPVRPNDTVKVDFARRSKSLHGAASSELFGRLMLTCLFVVPLTFSFFCLFVTADSTLNLQANSEISLFAYYWVAALWLSAGFVAVVRFLSYVDIRIRQEGWAVELRMRAEGLRISEAIE